MCTGWSGRLPRRVKGNVALHTGEGGSIYLKILEKSTQNNDEVLAQECEKHAATNAFLGQYLGSYHLRWTSKGKCEAFCRNFCRKSSVGCIATNKRQFAKLPFYLPTWDLTLKLEMLKGFIVFHTGNLICITKMRKDT